MVFFFEISIPFIVEDDNTKQKHKNNALYCSYFVD